jgi:hypothetical protein
MNADEILEAMTSIARNNKDFRTVPIMQYMGILEIAYQLALLNEKISDLTIDRNSILRRPSLRVRDME